MFQRAPQEAMIDLHGMSVAQAQAAIKTYVKSASTNGWNKINFVTGRGNHVNAKGNRGTLYHNFQEWIKEVNENFTSVQQFNGFYEVRIKETIPMQNPFEIFFNDAFKKYLTDNIEKIKLGAKNNNHDDMLALAFCYDNKLGVPQDYHAASNLYLQLTEIKNPDARILYEVGCRYFIGKGVRQNDAKAIEYYTRSADKDFVLAEFQLGNIYWKGIGMAKPDYILGNKYFQKAAEHGHGESARKLGCSYNDGLGVSVNYPEAIKWWKLSESLGDCVAAFNLSHMYEDCDAIEKNPRLAIHYLLRSAELGDPDGQTQYGLRSYFGLGMFKNTYIGFSWLTAAADNQSEHAQYFMYHYFGVLENYSEAKKYLTLAAQNNHIEAQLHVVMPSRYDFNDAFKNEMLEKVVLHPEETILAIKNNYLQQSVIGLMLCGDNTNATIKRAVKILKTLAKDKNILAIQRLGSLYANGINNVIKKNIPLAHQYWTSGANVNDAGCLCSLGYYWNDGLSGVINEEKALTFFSAAANLGDANAHNQLGIYFAKKEAGVMKNPELAVKHFTLAMELDNPAPKERVKKMDILGYIPNVFSHAACNLANHYWCGAKNFSGNPIKAVSLYQQAAKDGSENARIFLKEYYYESENKIKVSDSSLIGLLKTKSGLPFFGVRDTDHNLDAIVTLNTENNFKEAAKLKNKLGKGGVFYDGRNFLYVLKGINCGAAQGEVALRDHIQSTLMKKPC